MHFVKLWYRILCLLKSVSVFNLFLCRKVFNIFTGCCLYFCRVIVDIDNVICNLQCCTYILVFVVIIFCQIYVLAYLAYSGTPAMDTPLVWTPHLSGRLPSDSFDFPIGAHSKRASVKWTPRVYGQWTKIAAPMYYRI